MKNLPLEKCANGCDCPPDPPSKVICSQCQQEITKKLEAILKRLEDKAHEADND
jgi:hypothetical protein